MKPRRKAEPMAVNQVQDTDQPENFDTRQEKVMTDWIEVRWEGSYDMDFDISDIVQLAIQ